jgi:UDP-glucose 4-epimerase
MKPKTVLISGADGYIAHHLIQLLRKHNYKVMTATRNTSGNLKMDFSNPYEITSQNISGIDAMIHMVSPNETLYKTDSYRALSENAAGIHAALDFCTKNNISDFIYFSSFHVFGIQKERLVENTPVSPINDYGLAHCAAEQTVQMFDRTNQVNAWVVRPSNLFGVPENCEKFKRWNLIPFLFCKEAVERNTITLLTPGNQLRNFVGVSDVCRKVHWILEHRPADRIFHAFGKETMSVLQFAFLVQKVAQEIFHLTVKVLYPEGNNEVINFNFTSLYNDPDLLPKDQLETFVKEMLKVLLTKNRKE